MTNIHAHETWQIRDHGDGPYCAACGARLIRQASGEYLTEEEVELHLLIKNIYSVHDPHLHVMTPANRAKVVRAILMDGYRKPVSSTLKPRTVKRPTETATDLLGLDDTGGH